MGYISKLTKKKVKKIPIDKDDQFKLLIKKDDIILNNQVEKEMNSKK